MKRIGPNVPWRFRAIGWLILSLIVLMIVFSSCSAYIPPTHRTHSIEKESAYDKYKDKELKRAQLRYYNNQNNK